MKRKVTWLSLILLLVAAMLLASCSASTTTSSQTSTTTIATTTTSATASGTTVLTVTEGSTVKTYSMADLQALPSVSGYGGQISMGNTITGPDSYQGVALITLINVVGGITSGQNVIITGSDNYSQTLSYQQVTTDNFTLFDAVSGQQSAAPDMTPQVFVAYEKNGNPLDADTGPFEFGVMTCQNRVHRVHYGLNSWLKLRSWRHNKQLL